jgi:hypothetical protein|tara:strand:- start:308 stop:436 length:129 start_codon:yes stop_codon:yes gene_type:complete
MGKRLFKRGDFKFTPTLLFAILITLLLGFLLFWQISKGIPTP